MRFDIIRSGYYEIGVTAPESSFPIRKNHWYISRYSVKGRMIHWFNCAEIDREGVLVMEINRRFIKETT